MKNCTRETMLFSRGITDRNKCNKISWSWIRSLDTVKFSILSKARQNISIIKISECFCRDIKIIYPKMHIVPQMIQTTQNNTEKENKIVGLTVPYFKIYWKLTSIKTVCCQHKDKNDRPMESRENQSFFTCVAAWVSARVPRSLNWKRIIFSTNTFTIKQLNLFIIATLTQNWSKIWTQDL